MLREQDVDDWIAKQAAADAQARKAEAKRDQLRPTVHTLAREIIGDQPVKPRGNYTVDDARAHHQQIESKANEILTAIAEGRLPATCDVLNHGRIESVDEALPQAYAWKFVTGDRSVRDSFDRTFHVFQVRVTRADAGALGFASMAAPQRQQVLGASGRPVDVTDDVLREIKRRILTAQSAGAGSANITAICTALVADWGQKRCGGDAKKLRNAWNKRGKKLSA